MPESKCYFVRRAIETDCEWSCEIPWTMQCYVRGFYTRLLSKYA